MFCPPTLTNTAVLLRLIKLKAYHQLWSSGQKAVEPIF